MSWLKDPELFMEFYDSEIRIWRLRRKSGSPIEQSEFTRESNVTNYLSLVDNSFQWKKSDFDALSDILYKNDILVNCQGLVLTITFPRGRSANNHPDMSHAIRFWSLDVVNLSCYGLPAPTIPFREVQYIEGGRAPVPPSPKENELAAKLRAITHERYREKAQKHALDEKVLELEAMNSTVKEDLQRERDEKKSLIDDLDALENEKHELQKRVCDMGTKVSILDDELKKEKDEKKAVIIELDGEKAEHEALKKRVSELEATNATLNDKLQLLEAEQAEHEALKNRVSELEATNATLNDKLQLLEAEQAAKQAIVDVLNSESSSSTLKVDLHVEKDETTSIVNDQEQLEAEKQALEKRVADLEATNAALNDELQKIKNDKETLIKNLEGHEADKQALETTVGDSEASTTLNVESQKEKDDIKLITNDRDRLEAEKQALENRVSELETANATLNDDLQREKNDMNDLIKYLESQEAEKEALEQKVSDLEAANATLNDELKREKDDKKALVTDSVGAESGKHAITEVSSFEATSSSLNVDLHIEKVDDKEALEKRISELEALNATLKDELQKEKDAKSAVVKDQEGCKDEKHDVEKDDKESIMNDLDRVKAEKQALEKKVSDLETKYAALNSELLKKEEDKKAILNDKNGHEAEKQALEKIVSGLEATKISLNVEMHEEKNDSEEAEKQALKKKISDLEATICSLEHKAKQLTEDINIWLDEISELQEEVNQENKEKQALEKKVAELTSKLEKCTCGAAEESPTADKKEQKEPWMNDSTVPTTWVPYEELVQTFSRSSPLAMTKACECDSAGLSEDSTTNIQVHYFYRGSLRGRPYPVIVVKVEELIPNKEKARFDPSVWGLFNNAGTCYAARKPFESEM